MYGFPYTQNDLLVYSMLFNFFVEPADFLLIAADSIELHATEDHAHRTAAQQQSDYKIQHSFITSLSCGESVRRNSPNV